VINLRSARSRNQEVATQNRVRMALERVMKAQVKSALNETGKAAKQGFIAGGELRALLAVHEHEAHMASILKANYARSITTAAARVQASLTNKSVVQILESKADPNPEDLLTDEELSSIVRDYARANAAQKAKMIGETTRTRIQRAVAEGVEGGMSVPEIADLIEEKTYGVINEYRAELISRTETHAAMQYGSIEAAKSTDMMKTKTWLSGQDERVRDDHAEMDGQTVGIDEEFDGPCEGMSYPGDPSGPAEEVINCRCVLIYSTEE
jgi:uncharacterized protein with gpF-like domain